MQASKREKKRREVEERRETVNLYNEYILSANCYVSQKLKNLGKIYLPLLPHFVINMKWF